MISSIYRPIAVMFLRFFLLTFVGAVWCISIPNNPCPNVFAYRQQNGVYYGEIAVPYDGGSTLSLGVNISIVGLYQNTKLKLELLTPSNQILSNPRLSYRVNFPYQNALPRITQITFNGRIYCNGPPEPVGADGVTNLWSNLMYNIKGYSYAVTQSTPVEPSNDVIPPKKPRSNTDCGIANDIQTLVLKGETTIDNEYPWLVAMFRHQGVSYEFQCTGNLISHQHIITAAHCVWFYRAPLIPKEDILLVMGRSDISHWASTDAIIRTAYEVIPHPNYKQGSGHCDVALIKLNEEVTFKPAVRPVCLWDGDADLKRVVGSSGVVAGWGKSEDSAAVTKPRKITMPVVTQETCLRSNLGFKNLTSDKTFCAGNRDGSGPCSGDSGAGLILKRKGRWFLRGLVSTAIKNEDFSCNLNEFIVFSDIAKLKDWIDSVIK